MSTRRLVALRRCILLAALVGARSPLVAQAGLRVQLLGTGRDTWHGITRSPDVNLVPAFAGGFTHHTLSLTTGIAYQYNLVANRAVEEEPLHRLTGRDLWAQASVRDGEFRFVAGVQRHSVLNDQLRERAGPLANSTELYLGISAPNTQFDPQVMVWYNATAARGFYLLVAESMPLLAWPVRPLIVGSFDLELGINLSQDLLGPARRALVGSRDDGITHAGAGLTLSMGGRPEPFSVALGFKSQLNLNDATRYSHPDQPSDILLWVWLGVSYTIGSAGGRQ